MGLPLYQGYYTVHDMDVPSMGFVPHTESRKTPIQFGTVPEKKLPGTSAGKYI